MGITQKYRRTIDKKHPHPQKENTMSQKRCRVQRIDHQKQKGMKGR